MKYEKGKNTILERNLKVTVNELIDIAQQATNKAYQLHKEDGDWKYMGYVGAALETISGRICTGVNLSLYCGIGFCAEHSAIAEMVKYGETRIKQIVAVSNDGIIIPPCGRCREMILQIDDLNADTNIVVNQSGETKRLSDLLPINWRVSVGLMDK